MMDVAACCALLGGALVGLLVFWLQKLAKILHMYTYQLRRRWRRF